ncbi:MAG TPA: outer membrane protein assembly factor BamA [Thermoanaerobaculia bacterium]|jgi:outer membrane protein insertion porin family|nr:outer membrane protein assembly factor BamA [Thermoanaerobaculia bacterium]
MPDLIVGRRGSRRWKITRRLLAAVLLPLVLSGGIPGSPASAQDPQPASPAPSVTGRTIESIEFRGLKALPEDTLRYYLGIEPGQPLDEDALNRNIKQLWDRNLVDDIAVESTPTPAGVRLVITVQERPLLRSIEYEGLKRISKTDLQDKLTTQRVHVREGEPLSLGELQRVKTVIQDMYAEKGYRFATAQYSVTDLGPNEKKVVFTVDEGNRVRISDINFEGNTVFNDLRLRWSMKKTKETGLVTRFNKKDIYDPAKLQEDLDKVRELYKGAGYKNVVIGDPKVEVRALNPNAASPGDQKRRMFLTIPIEEGERWKFGQVTIEGNEIYTDQALLRAFEHKTGGWLRSKVVDDGVKQITDLYHNTGYIFARVDPELVEREGRVADVVVHVREGDQFKVGRIEFQGNDRTKDKVLRRELRLYEGGLMNVTAIRNSVLKVNQLGYFKLNEEDPVEIDTDTEQKKVNLVFKGDEADRTELQFGGGWSELDGFFGQFAVNTKNFLGRGEQVGVSVQTGKLRDFFDLSYFIPWFLDRPQSIGIRAYDQSLEYGLVSSAERYLRDSKGAVLTYGRNFKLFQSASLSYNNSIYNDETRVLVAEPLPGQTLPDGVKPGDLITQSLRINNSSLRPAYIFDSRDNPFEPTRGRRLSLAVEYAGGFLGGDNDFVRPEATFSIFQPVSNYPTKTLVALNVEGGVINGFGKGQLSPLERFFLGGENSIRGHRFRSIFLRDDKGQPLRDAFNNVLGGDSYVQLNLEYHFLLGGPFRLLLFADAGNVFGGQQKFDLSNLRTTAGVELRVFLPVFGAPLRFIYAKNLDPLPQDSFEDFQFSIGTSF